MVVISEFAFANQFWANEIGKSKNHLFLRYDCFVGYSNNILLDEPQKND
jgi:hypothetical protein